MDRYLYSSAMLECESREIVNLIQTRKWKELSRYERIGAVYDFVQNDILFGYNVSDTITATQVLKDGIGQCNTKSTLLMTLLRAVDIPCRLHGSEVTKDFQQGVTSRLIGLLAPKTIIHTWVEVWTEEGWIALEGVITDKQYINALKAMFPNYTGEFRRYAVAVKDFSVIDIKWKGRDTFIQRAAVVKDYGTFETPDDFFMAHPQNVAGLKRILYEKVGRKIMTKRVERIRKSEHR